MRVFIVDDHELFRSMLRITLGSIAGFAVVGEADSARAALHALAGLTADVVLVDVTMPGSNGLALIRELRRLQVPSARLVLTMHASADVVAEAFASGAHGYALKDDSPEMVIEAIRVVGAGGRYVSPRLPLIARQSVDGSADGASSGKLSPREQELFDLLARGYSNREIAKVLFISVKTVETHRNHIFKKLGVHSLADLVRFAAERGRLPASDPRRV